MATTTTILSASATLAEYARRKRDNDSRQASQFRDWEAFAKWIEAKGDLGLESVPELAAALGAVAGEYVSEARDSRNGITEHIWSRRLWWLRDIADGEIPEEISEERRAALPQEFSMTLLRRAMSGSLGNGLRMELSYGDSDDESELDSEYCPEGKITVSFRPFDFPFITATDSSGREVARFDGHYTVAEGDETYQRRHAKPGSDAVRIDPAAARAIRAILFLFPEIGEKNRKDGLDYQGKPDPVDFAAAVWAAVRDGYEYVAPNAYGFRETYLWRPSPSPDLAAKFGGQDGLEAFLETGAAILATIRPDFVGNPDVTAEEVVAALDEFAAAFQSEASKEEE